MTKRRVEDILYDESFKDKKCDKTKINLGINREKCFYFISTRNSKWPPALTKTRNEWWNQNGCQRWRVVKFFDFLWWRHPPGQTDRNSKWSPALAKTRNEWRNSKWLPTMTKSRVFFAPPPKKITMPRPVPN